MTTKHTNAPWSVSFYTGAIESGEKIVATVNYRISEGNPDNNAKLIAAAPDLLDALIGMMIEFGDDFNKIAILNGHAAIAKAAQ